MARPRTIFKNISSVSFGGKTVWGIKGFDVNVDGDYDTDGADNEVNLQPYGVQNRTGTLTFETGDILDVVKAFSVGATGSMVGVYVAKYQGGTGNQSSCSVGIKSTWCQNIAVSGAYGDTAGVTVTCGFNAGSLVWNAL